MIKAALLSVFAIAAAYSTPVVQAKEEAVDPAIVVAGFELATQLVPLIGGLFKQKKCRQMICWLDTSRCHEQAAAKVQSEVFQGRDGYRIEGSGASGRWVRYWRVRTGILSQDQVIASGTCGDGSKFSMFNCQNLGKVHC
ncbi:hypothetical protein FI667_g14756, partial [Globisporangium splendens]